jgi:hypothetical protein
VSLLVGGAQAIGVPRDDSHSYTIPKRKSSQLLHSGSFLI